MLFAGQKASAVAAEQQRQKAAHAEEAEESSAAASEFEEQQRESERLLAAARQRLEEALRSAAVEEGKMVSLKERYEEVMVRLDTELEAARLHGRDRLAAVEAEMEAIKETRERTVGDINAEEAAWRDRTANKDRYMRELEEANAVGIKRLQDDVESMRQVGELLFALMWIRPRVAFGGFRDRGGGVTWEGFAGRLLISGQERRTLPGLVAPRE